MADDTTVFGKILKGLIPCTFIYEDDKVSMYVCTMPLNHKKLPLYSGKFSVGSNLRYWALKAYFRGLIFVVQ